LNINAAFFGWISDPARAVHASCYGQIEQTLRMRTMWGYPPFRHIRRDLWQQSTHPAREPSVCSWRWIHIRYVPSAAHCG